MAFGARLGYVSGLDSQNVRVRVVCQWEDRVDDGEGMSRIWSIMCTVRNILGNRSINAEAPTRPYVTSRFRQPVRENRCEADGITTTRLCEKHHELAVERYYILHGTRVRSSLISITYRHHRLTESDSRIELDPRGRFSTSVPLACKCLAKNLGIEMARRIEYEILSSY